MLELILIVALAVVATVASGTASYLVLKVHRRNFREHAINQAVDHGFTYAEQMARRRSKDKQASPSTQKFSDALHVARDELKFKGVKVTEAELGRRIEVRVAKK